jgi:hypothetical protein
MQILSLAGEGLQVEVVEAPKHGGSALGSYL